MLGRGLQDCHDMGKPSYNTPVPTNPLRCVENNVGFSFSDSSSATCTESSRVLWGLRK